MEIKTAIFLLAGTSSRFRGIVPHKSLLQLCGQTVLQRLIIQAANLGVRRFVFGVGAAAYEVEMEAIRVLQSIPLAEIAFIYNNDYASTGNLETLKLCRGYMEGDLVILEGDIAVDRLPRATESTWVTVPDYIGDGCFVDIVGGRIVGKQIYRDTEIASIEWTREKSAGIFYLYSGQGSFLRRLEWPSGMEYVDDVIVKLHPAPLRVYTPQWQEMDTIEDFEKAQRKITRPVSYQVDPVLR